ncbi:hypothetical protein [Psychrobacter vallis]|uniref:hypothetical protein n=1 Tax=Psychrobacter vallis TaxID=248451 RepID=UPI0019184B76|nr:hypothetical protein [Psychrobacter vallis]
MNLDSIRALGSKLRRSNEESLILDEWSIFHTYTSFLDVDDLNLYEVAAALVDNDFAPCILHRDGTTWFKSDGRVLSGETIYGIESGRTRVNLVGKNSDNILNQLNDYAQESWYQSIQFRMNELIVFEDSFLTDYIRISVGLIKAFSEEKQVNYHLYLTIKLYRNGVIIVEYREISPQKKVHYADFISSDLNLGMVGFESVEVPLAIVDLRAKAYHESTFKYSFHKRLKIIGIGNRHSRAVQDVKKSVESGDFVFELAELINLENSRENLSSIAQTIFSIIGYIASNPRQGLSYIFFGQKKLIKAGNFWSGRPYTFIIHFEGQRASAKENINNFGHSLGCIMGRRLIQKEANPKQYLSKDYRYFDDYSIFLSDSFSLCVWSKEGVDSQKEWNDSNNGSLIYGQQAINEFLEYGYMINRMLLQKVNDSKDLKAVNKLRSQILDFKNYIKDAPRHGEIREHY